MDMFARKRVLLSQLFQCCFGTIQSSSSIPSPSRNMSTIKHKSKLVFSSKPKINGNKSKPLKLRPPAPPTTSDESDIDYYLPSAVYKRRMQIMQMKRQRHKKTVTKMKPQTIDECSSSQSYYLPVQHYKKKMKGKNVPLRNNNNNVEPLPITPLKKSSSPPQHSSKISIRYFTIKSATPSLSRKKQPEDGQPIRAASTHIYPTLFGEPGPHPLPQPTLVSPQEEHFISEEIIPPESEIASESESTSSDEDDEAMSEYFWELKHKKINFGPGTLSEDSLHEKLLKELEQEEANRGVFHTRPRTLSPESDDFEDMGADLDIPLPPILIPHLGKRTMESDAEKVKWLNHRKEVDDFMSRDSGHKSFKGGRGGGFKVGGGGRKSKQMRSTGHKFKGAFHLWKRKQWPYPARPNH